MFSQWTSFLFNLFSDFGQILLHAFCILIADDFQQVLQFQADVLYLRGRAWIEQNLLEQVIVFTQQAFGNGHVLFEGGARSFLVFHYRCKYKSGYKRNGQRIGHGLIMFVESIFKDIQLHGLIEVLEEDFAQVVAFADDDGILRVQVAEAGKGGAT